MPVTDLHEGPPDDADGEGIIYNSMWLLMVLIVLGFFGLLFTSDFCQPEPTKLEQTVFYGLLFLIFVEMVIFGWRGDEG